ncbi:hypothetical protein [Noviherbaspirillum sp. UKPF54]|uniref:hypothetical protein n=1 Tax=Noviherbaspirillum sp. UKPF54 TaxID=2601898 RepID=UPI00143DB4A8|nr:hypothetical protein [Noviherbaspirillum sp. UKPF54]
MFHETLDNGAQAIEANQQAVDDIVRQGPRGAVALAGVAVLIVLAIWFAFYLFVFVPRN